MRATWCRLQTFLFMAAGIVITTSAAAAGVKNPMNAPDEIAWELFLQVNANAKTSGNNSALFKTWASDHDTFQLNPPAWPIKTVPLALKLPALADALSRHKNNAIQVVSGGTTEQASEETRRNKEAYNYIVANKLHLKSGLNSAFGTTINFPAASLEVKANWYPVASTTDPKKSGIPGYLGKPADAGKEYHINIASDGKQYALVAMHVISKQVPNWTWATFEHQNNLGRCDIIGCKDPFGAQTAALPPNQKENQPYPACQKTPALEALFSRAKIDPAYKNYCLKGSQTDFTTATGLAIRLGNSVTESGFVAQASCMTCHSRAAFDSTGTATTGGGFVNNIAPLGAPDPRWFVTPGNDFSPTAPIVVGQADLKLIATQVDFVWSIPFCAVDDTVTPVADSRCKAK